jgi:RND family efflux transporter MFP subunit
MAQTNYQNLLVTSEKDIRQAEIARDQASKGQDNVGITTAEAIKSAELGYQTSIVAAEQAKLSLENRKKQSSQSVTDTNTNAANTADVAANASSNAIKSINDMLAFDTSTGVNIPYSSNLGALDSSAYNKAKSAYNEAAATYTSYNKTTYTNLKDQLSAVINLVEKSKIMADTAKYLLDKSISSAALPQSSATGPSLSGLQGSVTGMQNSIAVTLTQANGAKQGLANLGLSNDSVLDSLEKAYELAQKQVASAKQALESLKAGNVSQKDQAGFGANAAQNQFEAVKAKLGAQLAASKSQVDLSELQYRNALIMLEGLYDVHTAIATIDGKITKKSVENGDTVSAGQALAVISRDDKLKLQFFVDQDTLKLINQGLSTNILDNDGKLYPGKISSITQQADVATKRFMVEVMPDQPDSNFVLGTVMNVLVPVSKSASNNNNIILPLSAISIGQNESHIYSIIDGQAKKTAINIVKVEGESAEISTDLAEDAKIIVDGNKQIKEGDAVSDQQ